MAMTLPQSWHLPGRAGAPSVSRITPPSRHSLLSAGNALETAIVLEARRGAPVIRELDLFIYRTTVDIVSVDAEQVEVARVA